MRRLALARNLQAGRHDLPSPQRPESIAITDTFVFGNSVGYPSWEARGDLADLYLDIRRRFAALEVGRVSQLDADNPVPAVRELWAAIARQALAAFDP